MAKSKTEYLKALAKSDREMARLIKKAGPVKFKTPHKNPFQYLVRAIAYQQLHGKAAATIFARMCALFPGKDFPSPEDLVKASEDLLRSAGLSGAKVRAIQDIAQKSIDGLVPDHASIKKMTDEEIIERLTQIRGVGVWTVHMLLIFYLKRPDIWPTTDYGVRKGFAVTYKKRKLPTPQQLEKHGDKWKPYRSAAAWYLWRSLEE